MEPRTIHPETAAPAVARKLPWVGLLFLAIVFFIIGNRFDDTLKYHNVGKYEHYNEAQQLKEEEAEVGIKKGNVNRQIGFLALGLFGIMVLWRKGREVLRFRGSLGGLIYFFLFWSYLSMVWADNPALTFKRLIVLTMLWLGILAFLALDLSIRQVLWFIFLTTAGYLLIGIVSELVQGTFSPLQRFAGTMHPNSQGANCGLCLISGLFLLKDQRWFPRLMILAVTLIAAVFLTFTKSRTAIGATLAAVIASWILDKSTSRRFVLALNVTLIALLFLSFFSTTMKPELKEGIIMGRTDSNISNLSGRTPLWKLCLEFAERHPVLGYGFESFWSPKRVDYISGTQEWNVTGAHSTYLDVLLSLGLVGVTTFILMLLLGIIKSFQYIRATGDSHFAFLSAILVFCAVRGFTESSTSFISFFMCYSLVYLSVHSRFAARREAPALE